MGSNDATGWDKRGQTELRDFIRKAIRDNLPDEYHEKVPLLKQLLHVVREAIGAELQIDVNLILDSSAKETAPQARKLVEMLRKDFADLGLAFKDPRTGRPSVLALATTPPRNDEQSWLQLEPIDGAGPANRLARPIPAPPIIPVPIQTRSANPTKGRGS